MRHLGLSLVRLTAWVRGVDGSQPDALRRAARENFRRALSHLAAALAFEASGDAARGRLERGAVERETADGLRKSANASSLEAGEPPSTLRARNVVDVCDDAAAGRPVSQAQVISDAVREAMSKRPDAEQS